MQEAGPRLLLVAYFQQGGLAMYPLLLCSILVLAIGIERILVMSRAHKADGAMLEPLRSLIESDKLPEAHACCEAAYNPLARVMQAVFGFAKATPDQRQKALERAVVRETNGLERYMSVLATIGSVSPFIGLLGTVLGIMRAFRDIGLAGSAGGAVVAAGIAEALITTASGLLVAVISVIAYNHLTTWAQSITTNAQLNAEDLLARLED